MRKLYLVIVFIVLCLPLVYTTDSPFVNDEPRLFLAAVNANNENKLAEAGLFGSVGLPYGPIPTWIYQFIISVTQIPAIWVFLRAGFMVASIAFGLFLLKRATSMWKWFLPLVMVSPYIWYYSRHMWDNSFLLAFSSLALGSYAYFLGSLITKTETTSIETESTSLQLNNCTISLRNSNRLFLSHLALLLTIITTLILPLIHFMAIPLTMTILLHMIIYARKEMWKIIPHIIVIILIFLISHASYFELLIASLRNIKSNISIESPVWWKGWIFPFFGGRLLSGGDLSYFFGSNWLPGNFAFLLLCGISYFGYVLVLIGMFFASNIVWKKIISKNIFNHIIFDLRTHLSLIAMVSFFLQIILCGVSHSFFHPHYYNGIWIVYIFFAWLAVEHIILKKWGRISVFIYGTSLATILIIVIVLVHQRSGGRGWATIGNQLEIARKIGTEPRSDVTFNVAYFKTYPSLQTLQRICVKDNADRINGPLVVEYANEDPLSGLVRIRSKFK